MNKQTFTKLINKHLGLILFCIMLIIALISFKKYGVSWDESMQHETGIISYNYVFSNDSALLTWHDREYGVAFELPLIMLEKIFHLTDKRDIYLMRHLVTHLFYLLGCYFIFLIINSLYKNKLLASIGFFLLILHPRIYSHSFFNTKDLPFLSMYIIVIYYLIRAFDKRSTLNYIILGICTGLLINIRIAGVIMVATTLFLFIIDFFKKEKKWNILLAHALIFITLTCLTLYATWPYLWNKPLNNFSSAFKNMSQFEWNNLVLFGGELIKAPKLNWIYIPTWFSISTPILYILLGVVGILLLFAKIIKSPLSFFNDRTVKHNLLFFGYFIAPLLAIFIFHSVTYDEWRQLYFIYPSFVLLIVYGLYTLMKARKKVFISIFALLVLTFVTTSNFMIKYFPLQHVYFNNIFMFSTPEHIRKSYEQDYWGVSYKDALEYILAADTSSTIKVSVANYPGYFNAKTLRPSERERIKLVGREEATYFITEYRFHPQDYIEYKDCKFYARKIKNNTIYEIFKLK